MSYINENSFSRWIIEKSDGLTMLGLQKLSESVRDYTYLILMSQTSMRAQIIGHEARNLDAQRVFLNTFENIVNRRVNILEDIRRFQKTLQFARSKVDYVIGEFIHMLPSDMNLRIGRVKNYNNKILISSPSFKIGTNLTLFDMGFFLNRQSRGGAMRAPHHNFVVIAPIIMKFGTGVKLDVFYTMVTKEFVMSLLLRHYDVITCILANA